jgi:hypothetical protein
MNIILDFRLAMFDRGRDGEVLTQRRKGAKLQRVFCQTSFGRRLASRRQIFPDIFGPCGLATSRLCVKSVKVVKVTMPKNGHCKCLMVNAVKPSQGKSNHWPGLTTTACPSRAAKITGLDELHKLTRLNVTKTRINTLKYGYARINTIARKIFFPARGRKRLVARSCPNAISSFHPIDNL